MKLEFGKYIGYNQNPDWCESYLNTRSLETIIERIGKDEGSISKFTTLRNDTIYPTSVQQDKDLFQSLLDAELNKIEKFYLAQEKKLIHLYYQIGSVQPEEGDKPKFFLTCFNIFMNCEYENTKEKLKREMVDFFKKVDALRNFSSLNYLAIKQVLNKYESVVPNGGAFREQTIQKVKKMQFHSSMKLRKLHTDIEITFAEQFCHGSVAEAMDKLRPQRHTVYNLFFGGMCVGLSIALFLGLMLMLGLLWATTSVDLDRDTIFLSAFPVFRFLAFPVIVLWLWCILLILFQKTTINYVYILQLDTDSIISYMEIMRMAATFSLIWFTAFIFYIMSILKYFPQKMVEVMPASIYPFIALLLFILLTFLPFNIFWRSSRFGLLWTFLNIVTSPFGRLQFRDFLVADIFTSLLQNFVDVGYTSCWVINGGFVSNNSTLTAFTTCTFISKRYFSTIIPLLPYWWRFAQCLNKLYYTKKFHPHGVNAIKYFTGIIYVSVFMANVLNGDLTKEWSPLFIAGVACHLINSMYCWVWDVSMDWGLWSNKILLRDELLLNSYWKYYCVIAFDFFARLVWLPQIWIANEFYNHAYPSAIFSLIEIIRRAVWVFFRIEWEVMSNTENYRIIDFVPRLSIVNHNHDDNVAPSMLLDINSNDGSATDALPIHYYNVRRTEDNEEQKLNFKSSFIGSYENFRDDQDSF